LQAGTVTSTVTTATRSSSPSPSASTTFKPNLDSTFVYDLDNQPIPAPVITTKSGLKLNEQIYIVDSEGHTAAQIANYHKQGKKVQCYFSAGTWEPGRSDALTFPSQCYCGPGVKTDKDGQCTGMGSKNNLLDEWGEWWLDIHSPECLASVKGIMTKRILAAKAKGCDGVDPDNVDSYTNKQKFGNSEQDQLSYLLWLSQTARSHGLAIDLKNAGDLLQAYPKQLVSAFDFSVIESCHEYDECDDYAPFLAAGKPQIIVEYDKYFKKCPKLEKGQKLLVYSGEVLDSSKITLQC
ncbi:glycoside hydrolase superfamily, partial [Naematelia encephala]